MKAAASAIIVGGGIVGLACARALALRGLQVSLLERKPLIEDEGGIGIGLQNNALNALAEIGLADRVITQGVPVETLNIVAPNGSVIASRPAEIYCGSALPGYLGIRRASLHLVLLEAAREAGVTLVTGAEVSAVETADDQAQITLADGTRRTADILIACDGVYSAVRRQLFPGYAKPIPTGEAVWRALVPGEERDDVSFVFGGGVGTIGYCPLQGDLYFYLVDKADRPPPRDADDMAERMIALIGDDVRGFPAELAPRISRKPGDVSYRMLEHVELPAPWHRGRIILIGDAAHAGPPTLGQGAALGIEDAVVLARCLAEADAPEPAFADFMARRHARVRAVVDASLTIAHAQMEPGGQARIAEANRIAATVLAQPF